MQISDRLNVRIVRIVRIVHKGWRDLFRATLELLAPVLHESTAATGIHHLDGTLSLARLEPGTGTSEFFICVGDQPALNHGGLRNPDGQGFAAFGRTIDGLQVVRQIHTMPTNQPTGALEYTSGQMLTEPVVIHSIRRR